MSKMSWMERIEALCGKRGAPDGWRLSTTEALGIFPNYTHYLCKGAVYSPIVRGPRKGAPNFRKPIAGTERTFIFSAAEVKACEAAE